MKEIISPLADRLVEYIESRIVSGEYRVGGRLPSVRRFAAKFALSYGTVYRALDGLCERGLLERRGSSGLYVRARRSTAGGSGRIIVIMEPYVGESGTGLCHTAFTGMLEDAAKLGYQLLVNYVSGIDITAAVLERAAETADGVILLNEYDQRLNEYPTLRCPSVALLVQNSWNGKISTVNLDPLDMAQSGCTFFLRSRAVLRNVTIFSSPKPVYLMRGQQFKHCWEASGGRAELRIGLPGDAFEFSSDCGYFFTSDQLLQSAALEYRRLTGHWLTERHLVLGADGKQFLDPDFCRFPTIGADWRQMGSCVFAEMLRLIGTPGAMPQNINICGKLVLPDHVENHFGSI